MKEKKDMITTIKGKIAKKTACRKIKGEYYLLGHIAEQNSGDCYKINDRFYKADTGYIIYDHKLHQYVVKNKSDLIMKGVIGIKDNTPVFGAFSYVNIADLVILNYEGKKYYCLNEDMFKDCFAFREDLRNGEYYDRKKVEAQYFSQPVVVNGNVKNHLPYDSRGMTSKRIKLFDELFDSDKKFSPSIEAYGDAIKDLTFGLEFETVKGFIPDRITNKLGLISLRDGSINGLEYVTIPHRGKVGIQALVDSLYELRKRTAYNDDCSLHVHIGNIPRTEEFIVALYKVLFLLQDDFFDMFPIYKKYNFGVKRKHYTKPLPFGETMFHMDARIDKDNIKRNFDTLFKFFSMGRPYSDYGNDLKNVDSHPSDPEGRAKWQIKSRYYWVNFVPLLFGNKETIEFRIHTPTYDNQKVVNYLFLCAAIVNYVKENTKSILQRPELYANITFYDIMFKTFKASKCTNPNVLADHISQYLRERRDIHFSRNKGGDIKGDEDTVNTRTMIDWSGNEKVGARNSARYSSPKVNWNEFRNGGNLGHVVRFNDAEEEPFDDDEAFDEEFEDALLREDDAPKFKVPNPDQPVFFHGNNHPIGGNREQARARQLAEAELMQQIAQLNLRKGQDEVKPKVGLGVMEQIRRGAMVQDVPEVAQPKKKAKLGDL